MSLVRDYALMLEEDEGEVNPSCDRRF